MPTPEEDLAAILGGSDLGQVDAVFTISTGPDVTVTARGWFTGATEQTNILTQEVEAVNPMFDCPTSQIDDVPTKITVVINGDSYIVERKQRLGNGITTLHLKTKRG